MKKLSRRDLIKALGVSAFTYSLLPRAIIPSAFAQSSNSALRFFGTCFIGHGGEFGFATRPVSNGSVRMPTDTLFQFSPGYHVRGGALTQFLNPNNSLNSVVGPEWQANGLLPYLNMMTGFDGNIYWGHGYHTLGNTYTGHNDATPPKWKTLDQVLYQSTLYSQENSKFLFYSGGNNGHSVALTDPTDNHSPTTNLTEARTLPVAFSQLFFELPPEKREPARQALEQALLEMNGLQNNSLFSSEDVEAIGIHTSRLESLRDNIENLTCDRYGVSPFWNQTNFNQDYNYRVQVAEYLADMLVFSMSTCSSPLIYTTNGGDYAERYNQYGDFHENVAHFISNNNPVGERLERLNSAMLPWYRDICSNMFFKLAKKMKETPNGQGGNLLDDSLMIFVPEAGAETHESYNLSMMTAGNARGRWRSGNYIDFLDHRTERRRGTDVSSDPLKANYDHLGLPFINLLNSICTAAGLPSSAYELNSGQGFGRYQFPEYASSNNSQNEAGQRSAIPFNAKIDWLLNNG